MDKPAGPTSHDVVSRVRRALGIRAVGHTGTLDPFATGLLLVCVGRAATRLAPLLTGLPKRYHAVARLGEEMLATVDVERLARRRPGLFLAGAAGLGLVAGANIGENAAIFEALQASIGFLFFVSPRSLQSEWIRRQVQIATYAADQAGSLMPWLRRLLTVLVLVHEVGHYFGADESQVRTSLPANAPPDIYVVTWRVVSLDGHPVRGAFMFQVEPDPSPVGERCELRDKSLEGG